MGMTIYLSRVVQEHFVKFFETGDFNIRPERLKNDVSFIRGYYGNKSNYKRRKWAGQGLGHSRKWVHPEAVDELREQGVYLLPPGQHDKAPGRHFWVAIFTPPEFVAQMQVSPHKLQLTTYINEKGIWSESIKDRAGNLHFIVEPDTQVHKVGDNLGGLDKFIGFGSKKYKSIIPIPDDVEIKEKDRVTTYNILTKAFSTNYKGKKCLELVGYTDVMPFGKTGYILVGGGK